MLKGFLLPKATNSSGVIQPAAGGEMDCQASVGVVAQQSDGTERNLNRCRAVLAEAETLATGDYERKQIGVLTAMLADLSECPSKVRV